jgi:DnaJ-class molecular chaperone
MSNLSKERTLYEILEVGRNDQYDAIRASYRRLIEVSFSIEDKLEKEIRFHQLTDAWKVLCDESSRAAYDKSLDFPS